MSSISICPFSIVLIYLTLAISQKSFSASQLDTIDKSQMNNDYSNETIALHRSRNKRQYYQYCPQNCYSTCGFNNYCSQGSCQSGCCCPSPLLTACGGGPAVGGCINGLCGQGYTCTQYGFCCACASGNSTGVCVNNLCPTGFLCNLNNNQCCPLGTGVNLCPCINGLCPTGYVCGAGNLCYSTSTPTTG